MPFRSWLKTLFNEPKKSNSTGIKFSKIECDMANKTIDVRFKSLYPNPNLFPLVDIVSSALPDLEAFNIVVTNMCANKRGNITVRIQPYNREGYSERNLTTISSMLARRIAQNLQGRDITYDHLTPALH